MFDFYINSQFASDNLCRCSSANDSLAVEAPDAVGKIVILYFIKRRSCNQHEFTRFPEIDDTTCGVILYFKIIVNACLVYYFPCQFGSRYIRHAVNLIQRKIGNIFNFPSQRISFFPKSRLHNSVGKKHKAILFSGYELPRAQNFPDILTSAHFQLLFFGIVCLSVSDYQHRRIIIVDYAHQTVCFNFNDCESGVVFFSVAALWQSIHNNSCGYFRFGMKPGIFQRHCCGECCKHVGFYSVSDSIAQNQDGATLFSENIRHKHIAAGNFAFWPFLLNVNFNMIVTVTGRHHICMLV